MDVQLLPGERVDQLFSQDIQIIQSKEVFSYSIDAVLLAHFVNVPKKGTIVDLCTGNGAVALFMSRHRSSQVKIVGVEIQERLADMAQRSVSLNDLEEHATIIQDDLANVSEHFQKEKIDIVSCNPPYFPNEDTSQKNPNNYLALARHELTTNLEAVCQAANYLLKTNGTFYMVHRPDRLLEILEVLQKNQLMPKEIQFIYPKVGKDANMILIKAIKQGKRGGFKVLQPFFVHETDGTYTAEMKQVLFGE